MIPQAINDVTYFWDVEQNTDEWANLRAGMMTASAAAALLVKGKQEYGLGAGAITLLNTILDERSSGNKTMGWGSNVYTEYGHEMEPEARDRYTLETFQAVDQVGFVAKDDWIGCSPDGLVGDVGLVQIKCLPKDHVSVVRLLKGRKMALADVLDKKYLVQGQWELWVTGRKWNDFVFFKKEAHPAIQFHTERMFPDLQMHRTFEERSALFKDAVKKEAHGLGIVLQ